MFEDDPDDEDDDDDDNDNGRVSPLTDHPVAQAISVPESSASQEPADPAATEGKSSLFQAASFAGMDMDLFDDDEDD
jgi:hypothetical protein